MSDETLIDLCEVLLRATNAGDVQAAGVLLDLLLA